MQAASQKSVCMLACFLLNENGINKLASLLLDNVITFIFWQSTESSTQVSND
jgi:hypothetical protein